VLHREITREAWVSHGLANFFDGPEVNASPFARGAYSTEVLESLDGVRWLSGQLINLFLSVVTLQRALTTFSAHATDRAAVDQQRVTIFDTHFFTKLRAAASSANATLVEHARAMVAFLETRAVTDFQPSLAAAFTGDILIPIHANGNHWLLAIIPQQTVRASRDGTLTAVKGPRHVYLLDPMSGLIKQAGRMDALLAFLQVALPNDQRPIIPVYSVPDLPCQSDMTSCGVFVCLYAHHWLLRGTLPKVRDFGRDISTVPAHFRLFMAQTLDLALAHEGQSPTSLRYALERYREPASTAAERDDAELWTRRMLPPLPTERARVEPRPDRSRLPGDHPLRVTLSLKKFVATPRSAAAPRGLMAATDDDGSIAID
jgi:hypothetical protein